MSTAWDIYESPLGLLTLTASGRGLTGLSFPGRGGPPGDRRPEALAFAREQLEQYFAGERHSFELELDLAGSAFEQLIWQQLLEIPYGGTLSYGALAHAVGRSDIVRGVAAAVGRTPIPIVIPCHRVLGADGSLTGYGGGLERKRELLALERRALGLDVAVPWATRQLTLL